MTGVSDINDRDEEEAYKKYSRKGSKKRGKQSFRREIEEELAGE